MNFNVWLVTSSILLSFKKCAKTHIYIKIMNMKIDYKTTLKADNR